MFLSSIRETFLSPRENNTNTINAQGLTVIIVIKSICNPFQAGFNDTFVDGDYSSALASTTLENTNPVNTHGLTSTVIMKSINTPPFMLV
jgi:hypothetical protein